MSLRYHKEIQRIITAFMHKDGKPTTSQIQQAFFGGRCNFDSRRQRGIIMDSICRGRSNALTKWEAYFSNQAFSNDMAKIEYYNQPEIKKQQDSEDFSQFNFDLHAGKFTEEHAKDFKSLLGELTIVAVLFDRKTKEYSNGGENLLISKYGSRAPWSIPSHWMWCMREYKLYMRTLDILVNQLKRGMATGIYLPSGQTIPKALEAQTVVRALISDGTSWTCDKCSAPNLGTRDHCVICGKPRPLTTTN